MGREAHGMMLSEDQEDALRDWWHSISPTFPTYAQEHPKDFGKTARLYEAVATLMTTRETRSPR
jgi:hypothetical protein